MSYSPQNDYERFPAFTRVTNPAVRKIHREAELKDIDRLGQEERFWANIQPYLESHGYILRPRYRPGWKPWWYGTDINPRYIEEAVDFLGPHVMDARRISDDFVVGIKWISDPSDARSELDIMQFLSREDLRADPRNHCNPLLDSFPHPDGGIFIVMPWLSDLLRHSFCQVYEVIDMFDQLLEGLELMHESGVAHRDCTNLNIMQDLRGLFPGRRTHPIRTSWSEDILTRYDPLPRTKDNVRYYYIDFGISSRHDGPGPHLVTGSCCRDKSVPELSDTIPYDPFKLDVYILGNFLVTDYLTKYSNLEFLRPLLADMTRANPADRPSIHQARVQFADIMRSTTAVRRLWRLCRRDEEDSTSAINTIGFLAVSAHRALARILPFGSGNA